MRIKPGHLGQAEVLFTKSAPPRDDCRNPNFAIEMLREHERVIWVVIPIKDIEKNREASLRTSAIANRLLKQLYYIKASRNGYHLAVTRLLSIGRANVTLCPRHVFYPVRFCCRSFIPVDGEIFNGVVYRVHTVGVFLKTGPMKLVFLSSLKMSNYSYVPGEKPAYIRDDMSRIEVGVVVRFIVFAVRWLDDELKEFRVLASIDGDGLGPVSVVDLDEIDFVREV